MRTHASERMQEEGSEKLSDRAGEWERESPTVVAESPSCVDHQRLHLAMVPVAMATCLHKDNMCKTKPAVTWSVQQWCCSTAGTGTNAPSPGEY